MDVEQGGSGAHRSGAEHSAVGRWKRAVPRRENGPPELSWAPELPLWRRVIQAVGMPAVAGVVAFGIAVIITVVFVVRGALAESGAIELTRAPPGVEHAKAENADSPDTPGSSEAKGGPSSAGLIVHVVGEVQHPGIVELSAGARVLDAIDAAGGATPAAVLAALNLARQLTDGEQLVVPNEETAEAQRQANASGGSASGGTAGSGQPVSLNSASADQLQQLPGIGPALAERILEWRTQHGAFQSVEQLTEVSGIGAKTLAKFRDRLTL